MASVKAVALVFLLGSALGSAQEPVACSEADVECLESQEADALNMQLLQIKVELEPNLQKVEVKHLDNNSGTANQTFRAEPFLASLAQYNVSREDLQEIHRQLTNSSLVEQAKLAAASGQGGCDRNTGGSCVFSDCDKSRGYTKCVYGSCQCAEGHCPSNGRCNFDLGSSLGSAFGHTDDKSYTGGTCFIGNCDKSRGPTLCSSETSYQCKCRPGYQAKDGYCSPSLGSAISSIFR